MRIPRRNLGKGLILAGCIWGQDSLTATIVAAVLLMAGGVLHWIAKGTLEQNRALTTAGPYRWSRNPFYIANLAIDVGIACVIGEVWIAIIYFPLWGFAYHATILAEEERLRELFGARFEAYAAAVPRFLSTRSPLEISLAHGRFDWRNPNLTTGREYARLLGIGLAPAAIMAAKLLRELRFEILSPAHGLELGAVLLVPALWIFKLALAETLRRPEIGLLPLAGVRSARLGAAVILLLPLLWVALHGASIQRSMLQGMVAVGLVAGASGFRGFNPGSGRRLAGDSLLVMAVLGLGLATGELWLAIAPALWSGLSALDEVGKNRAQKLPAAPLNRAWRFFPRIATGTGMTLLVIVFARVWTQ